MEQPWSKANVPVQLVLYTSQAELAAAACKYALSHDKKMNAQIENGLWDLVQFLDAVVENPRAWPVTGQMAKSLKVRMRRLKGPREQPKPMGREARRRKRKAAAKERRSGRRASVAAFNAERLEREAAEARGESRLGRTLGRLAGRDGNDRDAGDRATS